MKWNVLVLSWGLMLASAVAQQTTVRIHLPSEERHAFTFDSTRVSSADVNRWAQLAEGGPFDQPIALETCFADPQYVGCGTMQKGLNVHNAELNLEKMRKLIRDLDENSYPQDLAAVVAYLKRVQTFWLAQETQELAFIRSRDISALASPVDSVDPMRVCSKVIDRIRTAQSSSEAAHRARFDWHNCVWRAAQKQIGPYPKQAWEGFLAARGIREQVASGEED